MKKICLFLAGILLLSGLCGCMGKKDSAVLKEELVYDDFPVEYALNDEVDVTKIRIKKTYADGSTKTEALDRGCVSGLDNITSSTGIKTITIKYKDITESINIGVYYGDDAYTEEYRSQFHYSRYFGWLNDPNGLVYNAYTGEYHLYYQAGRRMASNPANIWSERNWGHAVSTDLIHWSEVPGMAIYAENDGFGDIWSGACVVDKNNTSGLFDDSINPDERIVAVYSVTRPQQQYCMAYSLDGGYTFIKYDGNPVIDNSTAQWGGGFRDCKIYHMNDADGEYWLMITAGESAIRLFTSYDLIDWVYNSSCYDMNGDSIGTECPFLVSLPLDGDESNMKYVISSGGKTYYIGSLEKDSNGLLRFVCESEAIPMNGGSDYYATMDWYIDSDDKVIFTSWISDYYYQTNSSDTPDRKWEGIMSIPYEASLVTEEDGDIRLRLNPIKELDILKDEELFYVGDLRVDDTQSNILAGVKDNCFEIDLDCNYSDIDSGCFGFKVRKSNNTYVNIYYDIAASSLVVDQSNCKASNAVSTYKTDVDPEGHVKLRILVDVGAIDAIVNDGEGTISTIYFVDNKYTDMEFYTEQCNVQINELVINHLNSIYHKNKL